MKSHLALAFTLAIALTAISACGDDDTTAPAEPEVVDVFTAGDVFLPFTTTVSRGGTVRFHITRGSDNDGHNAIFTKLVPGAPPDIPVVLDSVVARTFSSAGAFGYVCTVHPGMAGEIVVE